MLLQHKELIKKIVNDALAEKRRGEIVRGQHAEEKLPEEFLKDAGAYIRVMKDDKCVEESGSVFVVMPFVKALRAALEHITYADAIFEINIVKEIHPLVAKEQIKENSGLLLQYGPYSAVLLPQEVPSSTQMEERLDELCKKAFVHEDAWKERGAQVFAFDVETILL